MQIQTARLWGALLVLGSLGATPQVASAAVFETGLDLPALTGSYATGTTYYSLLDPNRGENFSPAPFDNRQLLLQIWYPTAGAGSQPASYLASPLAEDPSVGFLNLVRPRSFLNAEIASDQATYPLLLFSHGFGELSQTYTARAEELASHGYVVASVTHPYDALFAGFPDGQIISLDPELAAALQNPATSASASTAETQLRAADLQFVLDELTRFNNSDPQNRLTARLDLENIGVFGHSLGGATAAAVMALDSRFDVGINLDGTLWGDVVETGIDRPFMVMGSGLDGSRQTFLENSTGDRYSFILAGAGHHNFADAPFLLPLLEEVGAAGLFEIGAIEPSRGAALINEYTLAFLDQYLKGQPQPLLSSPSPYPEVSFEFQPGDTQSVPEPGLPLGLGAIGATWLWASRKQRVRAQKQDL